ncbi:MAG: RlmE family RNA methyltransferase, partial [Burkholderiaceae bacterium]
NDPYVKKAQQEHYRSRAAYKLLEIDALERLLRPGLVIVDLGCAPGAWCQVIQRQLKPGGGRCEIIGLDMLPMEPIEGVKFLQGDFREQAVLDSLEAVLDGRQVDLVLSDMAPNLTGVGAADLAMMGHLLELSLAFARQHLSDQGALLAKGFHGSGFSQLVREFKEAFHEVRERKPPASRAESAETYLVGRGPRRGR